MVLAKEKKRESNDKRMRLPLRMKKAGKNVVPNLMMKKNWISYKVMTWGTHERSEITRQPSTPNSKEGQAHKSEVTHTLSLH